MYAIFGGSGFEKFDGFEVVEKLNVPTPFGPHSSGLKRVRIGKHEAFFLSRHGEHHEKLPTEVNFRANIFAFKKLGAKAILSFSAVGSLRRELKPGDMVVCSQYIDRTKGIRSHTFLGDGVVGHVSLAKPVCDDVIKGVQKITKDYDFDCHFRKTHVVVEGPYFSTKAESATYREMGADIIGMTHFPEYGLAREAGLTYIPLCFVTDYDCWDDSIPHVTVDEVMKIMKVNNGKGFKLAQDILSTGDALYKNCDCRNQGLKAGLMTPKEALPKEKAAWLEVLLS